MSSHRRSYMFITQCFILEFYFNPKQIKFKSILKNDKYYFISIKKIYRKLQAN